MAQNKIWFQKLFYKESVLAIKSSLDFLNFDSFKNDLVLLLPQDSKNSRTRIANNIIKRFFSDKKLYTLLPQVYDVHKDENLLHELIRYEFLSKEPIIADFFLEYIYPAKSGTKISSTKFSLYIEKIYGSKNENLTWWLQAALRDLGFIHKIDDRWMITNIRSPETALILLFHNIFLPYPDSIEFCEIENSDFWKFIGIKELAELKNIFYKAYLYSIIEFKNEKVKTFYPIKVLIRDKKLYSLGDENNPLKN